MIGLGKAWRDIHTEEVQVRVDGVVVRDVFGEGSEVGLVDEVRVVDGLQREGIAVRIDLGLQTEGGPHEGKKEVNGKAHVRKQLEISRIKMTYVINVG